MNQYNVYYSSRLNTAKRLGALRVVSKNKEVTSKVHKLFRLLYKLELHPAYKIISAWKYVERMEKRSEKHRR
jgi:hypothetical protein